MSLRTLAFMSCLLGFLLHTGPAASQPSPVPTTGAVTTFGMPQSGPGAFSIVVPDSRGAYMSVPINQIGAAGVAPPPPAISSPLPAAPNISPGISSPLPAAPNIVTGVSSPIPAAPNPPPGITTPDAASRAAREADERAAAARGVAAGNLPNNQAQIQNQALGQLQNPIICECRCPACPATQPSG